MHTLQLNVAFAILSLVSLISGHARIKHPRPLAAAPENPGGNYYNWPLSADGRDFPCKGLHKKAGVDKTPTEVWKAGLPARFEILGHMSSGEGNLAVHSGGSCQASLSFDNGETWKVLHSYVGGCPRGATLGSNIGSKNQTFMFQVPEETRSGVALFSWSWIAVTGNRNEMYQNCASVFIEGSGTSTLDDLPDMFVGDMSIPGQIGAGECRSSMGAALEYPNPGAAVTTYKGPSIPFKKATGGKCFPKATKVNGIPSSSTTPAAEKPPATLPSGGSTTATTSTCKPSLPPVMKVVLEDDTYPCTCVCRK